jgi:murein DD-endopeptidase MepM/ murein hydrolase activator NlpD
MSRRIWFSKAVDLQEHILQGHIQLGVRKPLLHFGIVVAGLLSGAMTTQQPLTAQQPMDGLGADAPAAIDPAPVAPAYIEPAIAPPESAPPLPYSSAPVAPAPSNESYIDPAGYSVGATDRTRPVAEPSSGFDPQGVPLPTLPTAVQVGPVSLSSTGFGLGTTPSVKDFYRRTLRPPGRLGNGNIQLIFPLSIPAPITSLFGWRIHPISGNARFHSGTDLGAPMGTPVLAAYAGQVALADFLGGYGLAVALDHNRGTQQTLYGHLSEVFVKSGDWVKQGTVIGRVGSTGNSTGPHLHFEFRELTPDGWVALDAGTQLEYSLAQLIKFMDVSEKGIASAQGVLVSQQSVAGISGKIEWQRPQVQTALKQPIQPEIVKLEDSDPNMAPVDNPMAQPQANPSRVSQSRSPNVR